ncbi:hypothetical protein RIF29_40477 [Crotalaria pallida]|uniref:F-box domain-containing protein n=1 Tax=Crotalaria pallida TaxID=3830 RepID=A0AAN9E389_CROPI
MEPPPPPPPSQSPLSADLLDDLVTDILSRLPVTSLLRFRCVSKPWDSLISRNPQFVQSHLRKSPKNANLILTTYLYEDDEDEDSEYGVGAIFYSKQSLIQNNISAIVDADDHISFPLNSYIDYHDECVGSCNGLEFGVRESWTQLFSISDQYIRFDGSVPATLEILCTFENGDVIVVANCCYYEAILCNWKNNTVEIVETRDTGMLREAKDYVESLVLLL